VGVKTGLKTGACPAQRIGLLHKWTYRTELEECDLPWPQREQRVCHCKDSGVFPGATLWYQLGYRLRTQWGALGPDAIQVLRQELRGDREWGVEAGGTA
jgi:hypothetical protein